MKSSNENIFRVTGLCEGNPPFTSGFPSQRPVTWSFGVFFDVRLNKRLSKQSRCWWFETPWRSFWHHGNVHPRFWITLSCPPKWYRNIGSAETWKKTCPFFSVSTVSSDGYHKHCNTWPNAVRQQVINCHNDVIKWKYFPRYYPFVRGIHRWPVNSPHKGQWGGALVCSSICDWTNDWANNRDVGDLRRHCAHYDVTVMIIFHSSWCPLSWFS